MTFFRVRFGDCNHTSILSETELLHAAKGEQLSDNNLAAKENLYACPKCLDGDTYGDCKQRAYHPIATMRKLSPLDVMKYHFKISRK